MVRCRKTAKPLKTKDLQIMQDIIKLQIQRDALDKQISDAKTAEVRKVIEELMSQIKDLSRQISETKAEETLIVPTISAEIADLQAKIEELKKSRNAYPSRINSLERRQQNISALIAEEQTKLRQILEVD